MSWTFVLRPREMELFRRCRRAWDLAARVRQNYVPITPTQVFDFDKALHDALAVYYFPAMDDWSRSIVRPLALQGFHRSMRQDRETYEKTASLSAEQEQRWNEHLQLGETVLKHYFAWAAMVDEFDSIFADEEFWVPILDPCNPDHALAMPDGRPMRYLGRVDQLISDPNDEYWVVDHRIVTGGWQDAEELLLDLVNLSYAWALEYSYPQLRIAGTVYNELRVDVYDGSMNFSDREDQGFEFEERDKRDMAGVRRINLRRSPVTPQSEQAEPLQDERLTSGLEDHDRTRIVKQEGNERFRRTRIRRSRASIEGIGIQLAIQSLEMSNSEVRIYPNPSPDNCLSCDYRTPCIAMSSGIDPEPILAQYYHKRSEELEEERLRWSSARQRTPPAFGSKASRSRTAR